MWRRDYGLAGSLSSKWSTLRGWPGWRSRRVVALIGATVLVLGAVPVVLIATGGGDSGSKVVHWPRPVAAGAPGSLSADPTAQTSTDGTTSGGALAKGQRPTDSRGLTEPEFAAASIVVKLRDPAHTTPITSRGATIIGELPETGFVRVKPSGDPAKLVAELKKDPAVAAASLDYGRRTTAVPNDEFYSSYQQSYLNVIRMPTAWDRRPTASQVVAVIDTGVDSSHPDLAGRLVAGHNVVEPNLAPFDNEGHGTFVAGVIAANANNGIGVAGVAWNARVMPIKVFSGELAYDFDVATGIVWAVHNGADIINMSLGGSGLSPLMWAAVTYATDRNVVVVAAAGNEGSDVAQYPAAFDNVVAVGATDSSGKLVDFSSYGDWVDVAAPGFDIVSTIPHNSYAIAAGTSFAAPIVAGVAAMIRAQHPALTQAQVTDRIRAAARDAGPRGRDPFYGYGVLDAARAIGAPVAADLPLPSLGTGEPNDVAARATPITLGAATTATIGIEGDQDWYHVESASPQMVTVTVDPPWFSEDDGQNVDPVLEVYNADLVRLAYADSADPSFDETVQVSLADGPVFVRIRNYNGAADPDSYRLTVTVVGPSPEYVTEIVQTGIGPKAVQIGDLTGDGRPDLVYHTAQAFSDHPDANKIFVRAQQPDGTLAPPVPYEPVQGTANWLAIFDVDQDGLLDLVTSVTRLEWFRQDQSGSLVSQGFLNDLANVGTLKSTDADGDGDKDLVAIRYRSSTELSLITHATGGDFTESPFPIADAANLVAADIGDVDGDGRADIVFAAVSGIRVYRNTASGWTSTDHPGIAPSSVNWRTVVIGDVTGDGRNDIVTTNPANSPNGVINVFRQEVDGSLAAPVFYDAGQIPEAPAIGDLDGDGHNDVALINNAWAGVTALFQQDDGTLGGKIRFSAAKMQHPGGQGLAIGDLDGNGLNDIVAVADSGLTIIRHNRREASVDGPGLVRSTTPVEYSTGAALGVTPQVAFATAVDESTVNEYTVWLEDGRTGAYVPASVDYDAASQTATIMPSDPLHRAKPYRIVVDGVQQAVGPPVVPFTSTFTTTTSGALPALTEATVRGQLGSAASVSGRVPIGDLGDVIVRYNAGTTAPATPTSGTAGYSGPDGGVMVGGLTPGQTYSFSVWYRDRASNLSSPIQATLIGTTLTMTTTDTAAGAGTAKVTFTGTVTTPTGPGANVPVPLVAYCAGGLYGGTKVATATGTATGALSTTLSLGSPRCNYRWQITNSTTYMGAASDALRVEAGPNTPAGQDPPRER